MTKTTVRRRLLPEQSRALIMDAVERLMQREGYAAISTRRVAAEAGLKSPLVHYYYPTLDDLLLAFYRRAADAAFQHVIDAREAPNALRALWDSAMEPEPAALGAEFIALAKHRPAIREEIAQRVETIRDIQAKALEHVLADSPMAEAIGSPEGAALLLVAGARALTVEAQIGISKGHADARRFIETCIDKLDRAHHERAGTEQAK